MRSAIVITSILAGVAVAAPAPVQVATVSSPSQFQLREAQVTPGKGVPSWPAMDGDAIKSGNEPVLITFPDGTTVILDAHSEAKFGMSGDTPVFKLLCGSANYSLKAMTAIILMDHDKVVTPNAVTGSYSAGDGCKIAGAWWSTPKMALVGGGAAAAAGLGFGIAYATQGGAQLSPSH